MGDFSAKVEDQPEDHIVGNGLGKYNNREDRLVGWTRKPRYSHWQNMVPAISAKIIHWENLVSATSTKIIQWETLYQQHPQRLYSGKTLYQQHPQKLYTKYYFKK